MHYPTLAEKYFLDEFVISCRRLGHRSGFPKVRNKVEMDDRLEELIHYGPKGEALNTFLCTEKVNLEAAGPTVRPFGNFRKFSLQLEGNEEANSHLASGTFVHLQLTHQLAAGSLPCSSRTGQRSWTSEGSIPHSPPET